MVKLIAALLSFVIAGVGGMVSTAYVLAATGRPAASVIAYSDICGDLAAIGVYVLVRWHWPLAELLPIVTRATMKYAVGACTAAPIAYLAVVVAIIAAHGPAHVDPRFDWRHGTAALFILTAAASEEILARSYLFALARRWMSRTGAALVAGFLFASLHAPYSLDDHVEFAELWAFAVALSVIAQRSGNLLPGIVVHALFNYGNGLSRLGLPAPLDHYGVFVYENGSPTRAFLICALILWLLIIAAGAIVGPGRDPAPDHETE